MDKIYRLIISVYTTNIVSYFKNSYSSQAKPYMQESKFISSVVAVVYENLVISAATFENQYKYPLEKKYI